MLDLGNVILGSCPGASIKYFLWRPLFWGHGPLGFGIKTIYMNDMLCTYNKDPHDDILLLLSLQFSYSVIGAIHYLT